jgi:hypothetical protein
MLLFAIWDYLADFLRDKYVLLWLGLLLVIGLIVNRGINRLVKAQRDLAASLETEFEKLSNKLDSLEGIITVDSLMAGIYRHIGHNHGESNSEAIRRWLDYRVDYERSSPHRDEDDARAEALEEIFKEIKPPADQPDQGETNKK